MQCLANRYRIPVVVRRPQQHIALLNRTKRGCVWHIASQQNVLSVRLRGNQRLQLRFQALY